MILELLRDRPMHGYEVMRALEETSRGAYTASPGSVYPALQSLEDEGLVSSEETDGRKVYTITDQGRAFLKSNQDRVDQILHRITDFARHFSGAPMTDVTRSFVRLAHASFEQSIRQVGDDDFAGPAQGDPREGRAGHRERGQWGQGARDIRKGGGGRMIAILFGAWLFCLVSFSAVGVGCRIACHRRRVQRTDVHLRAARGGHVRRYAEARPGAAASAIGRAAVTAARSGDPRASAAAEIRRRTPLNGTVRDGAGPGGGPGVIERCAWVGTREDMRAYHDEEWGVPVHDDRLHFEFLTLEGAQAGLSWETILRKRAGYREAFAGFDPEAVARFGESECEALLRNPGIVRNRLKILIHLSNARSFLEVQREFGSFDSYIWQFTDGEPILNAWRRALGSSRGDGRVARHEQGPQEAGLPVRGPHDLLRLHAGRRPGERSCGRLLPLLRGAPVSQPRPGALVTGASSGIGYELTKVLAREGHDVALVARSADQLEKIAADLRDDFGVRALVVAADLADPDSPDRICARLREADFTVDVLVNNAGFGTMGRFARSDTAAQVDMVGVNVSALTHLTRLYAERNGGARSRPDPERRLDRRVPAGAVHGRVLRHQGVRAVVFRSPGRRAARDGGHGDGPVPGPDRDRVPETGGDGACPDRRPNGHAGMPPPSPGPATPG